MRQSPDQILTVAQMRAAEEALIGGGSSSSRKRAAASSGPVSANSSSDDYGGGVPFKVQRGTATRAKHPVEHDFSAMAETNARLRTRQQERNPLAAAYRV